MTSPALDSVIQDVHQPLGITAMDTPSVREKGRPARESGLRAKVVVITGAGAGIGRSTALRFAVTIRNDASSRHRRDRSPSRSSF